MDLSHSEYGPFTKNSRYLHEYISGKPCFQHDLACDNKYLKELILIWCQEKMHLKQWYVSKNIASMVDRFFDKKTKRPGTNSLKNERLANKLHKPTK